MRVGVGQSFSKVKATLNTDDVLVTEKTMQESPQPPSGRSTVFPVVARPSRSRCASAAAASGKRREIEMARGYLAVAALSAAISSRFGPYIPGLTPPARRQSIASWPR